MVREIQSYHHDVKYMPSAPDESAFPHSPVAVNYTGFSLEASASVPSYSFDCIRTSDYSSPITQNGYASEAGPPNYPRMELREFIITSGLTAISHKAFASENAMRMYKEYSKIFKRHQDFERAKQHQNKSEGLPLLIAKRAFSLGLGDKTFLRLYECAPSPEARDRLYDKVDDRALGTVLKRKFVGYTRYRLQIRGVEIVVFAHTRLPIIDLKIENERFRFIRAMTPMLSSERFLYDLYLLTPDQVSLVDRMDSSMRVDPGNPLLGGSLQNLIPIKFVFSDRSKYASPHKCGRYEFQWSWAMLSNVKKCAIFSMYNYATGAPDANNMVEFRSLILVAVTMIIQAHEEEMRSKRSSISH